MKALVRAAKVPARWNYSGLLSPRCCVYGLNILLVLSGGHAATLPVYNVMTSGASASQASSLASGLGLDPAQVSWSNGVISFIDPTNFIRVPTIEVTDPQAVSNALARSSNKFSTIALVVQVLDFNALSNLVVLDDGTAVSTITNALSAAGLTPQFGVPATRHTALTLSYTNEYDVLVTNTQNLDTRVRYEFMESGGHPLVGPGAQVQVAYHAMGTQYKPSHLLYSMRQLQSGTFVTIISSVEASNRVAASYAGMNAQITPQLVYYCPPLAIGDVANIIPHYLCNATETVTNGTTVSTISFKPTMIPATDDAAFVPVINLTASALQGTQVVASVSVTGGLPPYSYYWQGSNPYLSTNTGASVAYVPTAQVGPRLVMAIQTNANEAVISWFDRSGNLSFESSDSPSPAAGWVADTHAVNNADGLRSVTIDLSNGGAARFFRLRYESQPGPETVEVTVFDSNGIAVRSRSTLAVERIVWPFAPRPGPYWGTESPNYLGDNVSPDTDTFGWRDAMANTPGAGSESFFWTNKECSNLDYIKSSADQGGGLADLRGVNTADIVFHAGHGAPEQLVYSSSLDLNSYDPRLVHSWGHDQLEWLCLDACNVLQPKPTQQNEFFLPCDKRWGPAFDGLHIMLGFTDPAVISLTYNHSFAGAFAKNFLGSPPPALPVMQAWFSAAREKGTGTPAAMGPLMRVWRPNPEGGVLFSVATDSPDYYWGKGRVGPTIHWQDITGFWYISD